MVTTLSFNRISLLKKLKHDGHSCGPDGPIPFGKPPLSSDFRSGEGNGLNIDIFLVPFVLLCWVMFLFSTDLL